VNDTLLALLAALPYIAVPVFTVVRVRSSRHLRDESAEPPANPPLVSVVVPARNEEKNIERCLRSILATSYPRVEVIVVDDHSSDATGEIARSIAATDPRVTVLENAALPDGWFGKQWACENGASASRGDILQFTDADTVHGSDLIVRSVNGMLRRNADLFTVAGRQEILSFWEKLVQPQVFAIMAVRYGGTETVSRSRRASDKIANGQCFFVRRAPYEELGRHALVKSHVGDDLMMAQRFFRAGKSVVGALGIEQLSTRMYTSLRELFAGWGKNVFVAGRDTVPLGWLGRMTFPLTLPFAPLTGALPALVLIASLIAPLPQPLVLWAAVSQACLLIWWAYVYRIVDESPLWAFLSPLGAFMTFCIFLRAVARGQQVTWKDRTYNLHRGN
jgi:chlorobactene glucosyltransferase